MTEKEETNVSKSKCEEICAGSSLSNHTDQSYLSNSSRSTLIKEILTSEKSKQIVADIDKKITLLVNLIKSRNYSDSRKKYYAKKIVNRLIDSKYTNDTSTNSANFGRQPLPTSTPYDTDRVYVIQDEKKPNENYSDAAPINLILVKHSSNTIAKTNSVISKMEKNIREVKSSLIENELKKKETIENVNLLENNCMEQNGTLTNRYIEMVTNDDGTATESEILADITPRRLYKLYKLEFDKSSSNSSSNCTSTDNKKVDINLSSKPSKIDHYPPQTVTNTKEQKTDSHTKTNEMELTFEPLSQTSIKHLKLDSACTSKIEQRSFEPFINSNRTEKSFDSHARISKKEDSFDSHVKASKKKEKTCPTTESNDEEQKIKVPTKSSKIITYIKSSTVLNTNSDLLSTSSENEQNINSFQTSGNKPKIIESTTKCDDWKYIKTSSEKILDKKLKNLTPKNASDSSENEVKNGNYVIKYADRERDRQIKWINNEITCLSKLRKLLEKSNVKTTTNLSLSVPSSATTQEDFSTNLAKYKSNESKSAQTLQEMNFCLKELKSMLKRANSQSSRSTLISPAIENQFLTRISVSSPVQISPKTNEANNLTCADRNDSKSSDNSSTSYLKMQTVFQTEILDHNNRINNLPKKNDNRSEFEVKYFNGTIESSTSDEANKENDGVLNNKDSNESDFYNQEVKDLFRNDFLTKKLFENTSSYFSPNSVTKQNSELGVHGKELIRDSSIQTIELETPANRQKPEKVLGKTSTKSSGATSTKSVAYFLTFEEVNRRNANENKPKVKLEKVTVQIPQLLLKTVKSSDEQKNCENNNLELQEYLLKNRSDFIRSAEWRRQCMTELIYMRDKRYEDINQRYLYTTQQMKDITGKHYRKSQEVQEKLKMKRTQQEKNFNRQLAAIFSKKLQHKTLKGQVTLSTSKTVLYS